MCNRVPVRILSVALVALVTSFSLRAAPRPAPTLNEVLARAAGAIATFAGPGHRLVCQENGRQTAVIDPPARFFDEPHYRPTPWAYRDIVASWSLTSSPDGSGVWNEHRSVHSGGPFTPFGSKPALTTRAAAKIEQTIDVPAPMPRFAVAFLSRPNQPHFEFSQDGETDLDGLNVWQVKFREIVPPLLWSLPLSGSFWIEPSSGRVLRSAIAVRGEAPFADAITVDYRLDPASGFNVPHTLRRRTHVPVDERFWVDTTGTFTGCRVLPASAP